MCLLVSGWVCPGVCVSCWCLTLGVYVILLYIILYIIIYYTYTIIILYIIIYYTLPSSALPFLSYSSYSSILLFLSHLSSFLFQSIPSPLPSSSLLIQYSFYTCRYFDNLIYIPSVSDNLTPHVLSEWMVEV